jgi:hypothetical protein
VLSSLTAIRWAGSCACLHNKSAGLLFELQTVLLKPGK